MAALAIAVSITATVYGLYCLRMKYTKGRCNCKTDLTGKTAIVTGSDKGIGYWTAADLARRNARVILACRNQRTAADAAAKMRSETGNSNVVVYELDLSLMRSVRQFATTFSTQEDRLDILVNNAGTSVVSDERSAEGLNYMFATNYVGHFLLTNLLLDKLKQSAPSRIVNVSSVAHKFGGPLDLNNLNAEKSLNKYSWYSYSKLEQILFTRELSNRLKETGVTVNAVHPGSVRTNLLASIPQPVRFIMNIVAALFFRSAEEGAQTSIHVAVSTELEQVSGEYFSECRIDKPSSYATDDGVAKKLFELTEKYTNM